MNGRSALVTGFEPYGGRSLNPSAEVARRLDGERFGAATVVARILPVEIAGLHERIAALVRELHPALIVSLGLAPGESTIRLERVGLNLVDYRIPDNAGAFLKDSPVVPDEGAALFATLPLRRIEARLLESGIPATLSASAGTFLCNATLYGFLRAVQDLRADAQCGFVHLPLLPEQAATHLRQRAQERAVEAPARPELASMHLDTMLRALRLLLDTCLSA
jgi:pyroglutamyl-peptidase